MGNDKDYVPEPDETPSKKLPVRMLKTQGKIKAKKSIVFSVWKFCIFLHLDILRSFRANFEFNHDESDGNEVEQKNQIKKPLGKLNVNWEVTNPENISHFIIHWRSSKDLRLENRKVASTERSFTIG